MGNPKLGRDPLSTYFFYTQIHLLHELKPIQSTTFLHLGYLSRTPKSATFIGVMNPRMDNIAVFIQIWTRSFQIGDYIQLLFIDLRIFVHDFIDDKMECSRVF